MEDRRKLVLKGIVDQYIKSAEPVSSQTLLERYNLGVCSATIRNDMQYLEEQGYIEKPYSSSGRVPTEKGYRFFVDWLLELSELTKREQSAITEYYRFRRQELDPLLRNTAFLLANLTGLVGFILSPRLEETRLEQISLVRLGPEQLLVVLVSNLGLVESQVIDLPLGPRELEEAGALLGERLRGQRFREIVQETQRFFELEEEKGSWIEPAVRNSFEVLREVIARGIKRRLYLEGLPNLMELLLKEKGHGDDTQGVVRLLGDERRLAALVEEASQEGEIKVLIGTENPLPELHRCSLVTMGYGYRGVLGVLGPIRMDYSKAVSVVKYVASRLQTILMVAEREASTATPGPYPHSQQPHRAEEVKD